ncbi:MAG: oligosaccharide repeat unit polymerase [Clostridia bacterium]|nr:oligosaccharide repeat unit polymerase [Clostridia bacterium]
MTPLWLMLIFEILLIVVIFYFTNGDYISPSFITIVPFAIATAAIIINEDYWSVSYSFSSAIVILTGLALIVLEEILVKSLMAKKAYIARDNVKLHRFDIEKISLHYLEIFALFSVGMMLYYVFDIVRTGGATTNILSNIGIVHTDADLKISLLGRLFFRIGKNLAYPSLFIIIYNIVAKNRFVKYKLICLIIPIISSIVMLFFCGGRSGYLSIIVAALVFYIMLKRTLCVRREIRLKKIIKPLILVMVVFLLVFFGSKTVIKNKENTSTPIQYITYYVGSPLYLFDKVKDDVDIYFPYSGDLPGAYSFIGIYQDVLGKNIIPSNRFCYIGGKAIGGGNVYTIFAIPYRDFGVVGMYAFILIYYSIFIFLYYKIFYYPRSIKYTKRLFILGILYNMIFMSFYVSMSSNFKLSTIVELIVAYLMLCSFYKIKIKR